MSVAKTVVNNTANFDPVARIYRWVEYLALGPLLQRTRTHFLPQVAHARHAFVLGDGDGRFLAKLLQQNRSLQALAVDSSDKMLALLLSRCDSARVKTVHANALTQTPPLNTDLVVTHFFLDCFTQSDVDKLALQIGRAVQPGTLWLISDFRIPERGAIRPVARAYVRSLYFAFRVLTGLRVTQLPNHATALCAAGFHRVASHLHLGGVLFSELWQRSEQHAKQ